ncbi:MAG: PRC-barrel domain-containing protein [Burkholderiaceae bacterium]|nr:PRC-barrel domain-containing protein [Burkholderiaceae bacterium]
MRDAIHRLNRKTLVLAVSLPFATASAWAASSGDADQNTAARHAYEQAPTQPTQPRQSNRAAQSSRTAQPDQSAHGERQILREARASTLIGATVHNSAGKALGEIHDLIVDLHNGDVRYAVLSFDPGVLVDDKLFGVPTTELRVTAGGENVLYDLDPERLERAALDRETYDDRVVDGNGVLDNLDAAWDLPQPDSSARAHSVRDLIDKDVVGRMGKEIGEVEDLVIDMSHGRVHYAVLGFDAGSASPEQNFALPLRTLSLDLDGDSLVLNVPKSKVQAMKSFTDDQYAKLNDPAWVADIDRYFVAVFPAASNSAPGGMAASEPDMQASSGGAASSSPQAARTSAQ